MSIEQLFGGLVPSPRGKLAGLGSDPTKIGDMGQSLSRIRDKMVLPSDISPACLLKQAEELGTVEGEVEIAKQLADTQGKQVDKLMELHRINAQYTQKMMGVDQSLRQLEANHGRQVAKYQLKAAETQASFDGYTQAYQMGAELFG